MPGLIQKNFVWRPSEAGELGKAELFRLGDEPTPSAATPKVTVLHVFDHTTTHPPGG